MPVITIIKVPTKVSWSGQSPKIKIPSPIAPSIEVYRKGETKLISPVLMAITLSKVAIKTAIAAPSMSNHDTSLTVCHSVPIIIIPANKALPRAVDRATVMVGTSLVSLWVEISLTVMKIIATRAQSE